MKLKTILLGSIAAAVFAAPAYAVDIKIGVMNDRSGIYADIAGEGSVVAARMAVEDFDERAAAVLHRTESLRRRGRRDGLVIVPRTFRLVRRLDAEQVGIVDLAAVGADFTLTEERIVGRHFLHLGDDVLRALVANGFDSLQVVQNAGVDAGLNHRGLLAVLFLEAGRPFAGLVVEVPVEARGQQQALCDVEA